jgi:hypothetical protein
MNIRTGRQVVTTAGTAVALATENTPVSKVIICPETDNTNPVTVGDSEVVGALATRRGIPLDTDATTHQLIEICDVDLKDVFIDSVTSGEGVTFTYFF